MVSPALFLFVAASVTLPTMESAPRIDCALDEPAWASAARLTGFRQTQPGDNVAPSRTTVSRIFRTAAALHIAIEADDDPSLVKSTLAGRDAILGEDHVEIYLDTFHDRRRAYVLMVNARGVQQDGLIAEGRETDYSVDLVFQSAGCVTSNGYTVELTIPFSSLRYQSGEGRTWGLHLLRITQRLGEEDSWMPLRRDRTSVDGTSGKQMRARFLSQSGAVGGFGAVEHAKAAEWIPVLGATRAPDADSRLSLGGTGRISLSSAATLDFAANPDFAEVEADAPQSTANQRFPLFFPEKRPFFLEGADLLKTPIRVFHSRTILDPDAAVKFTTTRGRTNIAALGALDPGPGRFSKSEIEAGLGPQAAGLADHRAVAAVVRVRQDVGLDSSLGLIATSWSFAGRRNQVAGVDGRVTLGPRTTWTFQTLASSSRVPYFDAALGRDILRSGTGLAYVSDLSRTGRHLSLQLTGDGYSRDYRAALGYLQRSDTHRWSLISRYDGHPAGGPLLGWSAVNTGLVQFDGRGRAQYGYVYPRLLMTMKRQTYFNLSGYRDYVRVFEEEFGQGRTADRPGAFAGPAQRSSWYHGFTIDAGSSPSRVLSIGALFDQSWNNLDFDQGAGRFPRVSPGALLSPTAPLDPGRANSMSVSASLTFQPTGALRLSQTYDWNRLTRRDTGLDAYRQHLSSTRLLLSFSRFLWLRGRLDYDSLDRGVFHQAVFGWTPAPGRAIYAGYDETGEWDAVDAATPANRGRGNRYVRRGRTLFVKVSWSVLTRLGGRLTSTSPS
jgi:hypothetical protein